jgi:general secretion pathway protein D
MTFGLSVMQNFRFLRLAILVSFTAMLLSGCAGWQAFRDGKSLVEQGQFEAGFKRLDDALVEDPKNVEYKVYIANRKQSVINSILARADVTRSLGRLDESDALFKQVLAIDSKNPRAIEGQTSIATELRHRTMAAQADKQFTDKRMKEADELVRAILAENPNQRDANQLKYKLQEKKSQETKAETRLSDAYRKTISLDFRDAQLRSVLDVIAKASGLNFIFDKEVKPDTKVNIVARNTTVDDALKLLSVTNQLDQKILNDNTVLIYPNTAAKQKDYQALMVRSFYLSNADVKQVSNTLKTILKSRDLVVNEKLNLIIMRDTPEAIRLAEKLIALEDIGESEVMLEVEVMELKRSRLSELGVRWPDQVGVTVTQAGGNPLSLFDLFNFDRNARDRLLGSIDVRARTSSAYAVNLLNNEGDTNLLANPRIRVRNREKAKILIGDRVPVITTTQTATGFSSDSVNYLDVGLKLEVEPNIYLDDEVAIKVSLEVSSIAREITTRSGTLSYQIGTRNASTVLKLKDGETQVLAGLISDEDRSSSNRVPGLGKFPLLGRLFSSQRDDTQKTEIVLAITPRLIRTVRRPDLVTAEFDSGTESSLGGRGLQLGASAPSANTPQGAARSDAGNVSPGAASAPPPPQQQPRSGQTQPPIAPSSGQPQPNALPPVVTPPSGGVQATVTPAAPTATGPQFGVNWQGPANVRSGEQFSVSLRVQSQQGISSLPLLISFDPGFIQITGVTEGDFMKSQGSQTEFRPQIDGAAGRVFVSVSRASEPPAKGDGAVLTVNARAIRAGNTSIQLLGITPNPEPSGGVGSLPIEHSVTIAN